MNSPEAVFIVDCSIQEGFDLGGLWIASGASVCESIVLAEEF